MMKTLTRHTTLVGFLGRAFVVFVASLLLAIISSPVAWVQEIPDPVLQGTIDTHIHTEEEYAILDGGSMDIIELARRARDKGMRAIVVKSLKFETATRAYIAREHFQKRQTTAQCVRHSRCDREARLLGRDIASGCR